MPMHGRDGRLVPREDRHGHRSTRPALDRCPDVPYLDGALLPGAEQEVGLQARPVQAVHIPRVRVQHLDERRVVAIATSVPEADRTVGRAGRQHPHLHRRKCQVLDTSVMHPHANSALLDLENARLARVRAIVGERHAQHAHPPLHVPHGERALIEKRPRQRVPLHLMCTRRAPARVRVHTGRAHFAVCSRAVRIARRQLRLRRIPEVENAHLSRLRPRCGETSPLRHRPDAVDSAVVRN
mmetsp:Transcript_33610/g.79575  ORF Transcript_33610/g.79575 Transcript_33610/m.79575 type:complete len:240 (-) Transcript_33610:618-1337(-)